MNEQTKNYTEKQHIVEEYIQNNHIYEPQPPLKYDLRGYAEYVTKNNLTDKTVSKEIIEMFRK